MRSLRRRDARAPDGPRRVDATAFDGCWLNTSDRPQGVARLTLERRQDGLRIHSLDALGGRVDWRADSFLALSDGPDSTRPTALVASCEVGETRGRLEGSLNLGLLVLALYRLPRTEAVGYFSREFFLRVAEPPAERVRGGPAGGLFPEVAGEAAADLAAFCGSWLNTDPDSAGIARITIEDGGSEGPRVEAASAVAAPDGAAGPQPRGWGVGQTGAFSTVDEAGARTASLLTTYRLGFMTSRLQLRLNGGALVLANFNEFHDGSGRLPYFTREFYRRR